MRCGNRCACKNFNVPCPNPPIFTIIGCYMVKAVDLVRFHQKKLGSRLEQLHNVAVGRCIGSKVHIALDHRRLSRRMTCPQ